MEDKTTKKKKIGVIFNDIDLFIKACVDFDNTSVKTSISQVAEGLRISPTALIECFKRLNEEFGTPLVKTKAHVSGVEITEAGRLVLERAGSIFDMHTQIKAEVAANASRRKGREEVIRVSASPYLLAHLFPQASATFKPAQHGSFIRIECEEGYYTDEVIDKIASKEIDFAVTWSYPEKLHKARIEPEITCARASESLTPILVFGKDHKFKDRIKSEDPSVFIEELADETLFLLDPAYQALYDKIPHPNVAVGAKRVTFTTITSIVGSLRSGMHGAAILPAIYKDVDRYRRDGNLFFLPLKSRDKKLNLNINIIYIFKGPKPHSWKESELPTLDHSSLIKMRSNAVAFLRYVDDSIVKDLIHESGWARRVNPILPIDDGSIRAFHYAYHVSPPEIGMSEPVWNQSNINFYEYNKPTGIYKGTLDLCKQDADDCRHYALEAELINRRIFSMRGYLTEGGRTDGDAECFVANFNFMSPNGDHLIGIVSGQDDEAKSPMICSIVLSKKGPIAPKELIYELQVMKNRTLIRTDAQFFY